ncbi:hypothetical protein [Amaricoccus macauensis]|uniref:hypothetical protein n=1 Tax=Amaricoccus macauensis TaxID=57001 RepID=UPI003C7A15C3
MPKFTFTKHRHDSRRWVKNGREIETHTLELAGTDEATGKTNRAILIFDSETDLQRSRRAGTAGYITGKPDGGVSLVGWLPHSEFATYLEVLESGEALTVYFALRNPDSKVGYVRRLGIGRYEKILAATICRPDFREPRGASNVVRFPI